MSHNIPCSGVVVQVLVGAFAYWVDSQELPRQMSVLTISPACDIHTICFSRVDGSFGCTTKKRSTFRGRICQALEIQTWESKVPSQ